MLRFRKHLHVTSEDGNGILEDRAWKVRQGILYALFTIGPF